MPRIRKPARLWYDTTASTWCILDGGKKQRLGLGEGDRAEAERRLESHLIAKRSVEKPAKQRRADQVFAAEVLDRYASKRTDVARPKELAQRISALLDYWGEMTLDEIDEDSCEDFVNTIGSASYGRRCLEDFRAAVNAFAKGGYLREIVMFTLPRKPAGRVDWLTKEEVIALCRTADRYRETQRGKVTERRHIKHIVQFVAAAVGTCSRSARIYEASYVAEPGRPYVDLEAGLYYRAAPGEAVSANKQAPTIPVGDRLLKAMKRWHARGDRYVVQYAGRPVDCKKAFNTAVSAARKAYPDLFKRPDGSEKLIVRHTLRHTGVTWLAIQGVDPYEICKFAGLTMETFERVYSHHHPDFMAGVRKAQAKPAKVTKLVEAAE